MTREEAINHLKDILAEATETEHAVCYVTNEDAEALEMAIEALKEQKTGHWQKYEGRFDYNWECSECGCSAWEKTDYCAYCGAKMECEEE